jgi:hypothetical protein
MPVALSITKAYVQPVRWTESGQVETTGEKLYVQFNPQTLKVTYSNQKAGGDQPGTAPIQFVGKGTTKLAVELLFDVTGPMPDGSALDDVRDLTLRLAAYLEPKEGTEEGQYVPPGIRFGWAALQFDGVLDSMDETLEFFAPSGKPLRATVSLQISKQEIKVTVPAGSPGTSEQHLVEDGETLQGAAAAAGRGDWQNVAAANGIENPRMLQAGALVDLKAGVGLSAGFSAGVSGGLSGGVSGGLSGGVSGGVSGGLSAGGGLSIGAANALNPAVAGSLGFGASAQGPAASLGAGASLGASAGGGVSASGAASGSLTTRIR